MLGGSALVGLVFAPLFVLLTELLLENKGKVRILAFFGRHSTNMWLVHFHIHYSHDTYGRCISTAGHSLRFVKTWHHHVGDAFEVSETFIPHHYACSGHHHTARPDDPHPGHYPPIPPI